MDGILVVNKPKDITSHDVVNIVRRAYKTKKVGHVGTLDPIARGVLVVCVNQATKLAPFLENDSKAYECEVLLGMSTDTYDTTGKVINKKETFEITLSKIDDAINQFLGEIEQYPPIYSAIKVNGKKLYQYARNNEEVKIQSRKIKVYEIKRVSDIYEKEGNLYFKFYAFVSKGTYIRSLVQDLGTKLDIPCCMSELIRVKSGQFVIEKSYSIEDIELGKSSLIKMVESIAISKIDITNNPELINKIKNGMKLSLSQFEGDFKEIAFILNDELFAIYEYNDEIFPCYKACRVWL